MAFKKGYIPWNKGRKVALTTNLDGLELGHQEGQLNHNWKGDSAGYHAIHRWIVRKRGKASVCEHCGKFRRCVWANISGEYLREESDYLSLCYSCHFYFDKVGKRMWQTRKERS